MSYNNVAPEGGVSVNNGTGRDPASGAADKSSAKRGANLGVKENTASEPITPGILTATNPGIPITANPHSSREGLRLTSADSDAEIISTSENAATDHVGTVNSGQEIMNPGAAKFNSPSPITDADLDPVEKIADDLAMNCAKAHEGSGSPSNNGIVAPGKSAYNSSKQVPAPGATEIKKERATMDSHDTPVKGFAHQKLSGQARSVGDDSMAYDPNTSDKLGITDSVGDAGLVPVPNRRAAVGTDDQRARDSRLAAIPGGKDRDGNTNHEVNDAALTHGDGTPYQSGNPASIGKDANSPPNAASPINHGFEEDGNPDTVEGLAKLSDQSGINTYNDASIAPCDGTPKNTDTFSSNGKDVSQSGTAASEPVTGVSVNRNSLKIASDAFNADQGRKTTTGYDDRDASYAGTPDRSNGNSSYGGLVDKDTSRVAVPGASMNAGDAFPKSRYVANDQDSPNNPSDIHSNKNNNLKPSQDGIAAPVTEYTPGSKGGVPGSPNKTQNGIPDESTVRVGAGKGYSGDNKVM